MASKDTKILNISVFKFYEGSIEQFKYDYAHATAAVREQLDNSMVFIHENDDSTDGYLYAHGKYYNLGIRPSDVLSVMDSSDKADTIGEISEAKKLRLISNVDWVTIDTEVPVVSEESKEDE